MTRTPEINQNRIGRKRGRRLRPAGPPAAGAAGAIWGRHAVLAALGNPRRVIRRLLATGNTAPSLLAGMRASAGSGGVILDGVNLETVDRGAIEALLPAGAVHQGMAALADPLPPLALAEIPAVAEGRDGCILILDRVEDPRNVGAVLRSAAAFGAHALVLQDRRAPPESGVLAKAASGGLEVVPLVRVTNLARAIAAVRAAGFWAVGLDGGAPDPLDGAGLPGRVALVLGGEGGGMRRLTREGCDEIVRLPTHPPVSTLNVAAAAAIALYAIARRPVGTGR